MVGDQRAGENPPAMTSSSCAVSSRISLVSCALILLSPFADVTTVKTLAC